MTQRGLKSPRCFYSSDKVSGVFSVLSRNTDTPFFLKASIEKYRGMPSPYIHNDSVAHIEPKLTQYAIFAVS